MKTNKPIHGGYPGTVPDPAYVIWNQLTESKKAIFKKMARREFYHYVGQVNECTGKIPDMSDQWFSDFIEICDIDLEFEDNE